MNEMKSGTKVEERLKRERDLLVPTATAPSAASLQHKAGLVRRRRTVARITAGAAAMLVCVIGGSAMFNRGNGRVTPQYDQVAVGPNMTPDIATEAVDVELIDQSPVVPAGNRTPSDRVRSKPKIQLYATVRGSIPVFDIDADAKEIHHVGWAESEQRVPVDMRYVPENQQETFNAVLSDDDRQWHLDL